MLFASGNKVVKLENAAEEKDEENWKKLKMLEDEELYGKEARTAAHVVASELNGHVDSSVLDKTKYNQDLRIKPNASNAIFYMDKFNEHMGQPNKLIRKSSKSDPTGRIDAERYRKGI